MTESSGSANKLTDERAANIGWYFIHSYYDFYNKKIENIHKVYNKIASISHSKFPAEGEEHEIYKAKGTEAIKARFNHDDVTKKNLNRIVITNAIFEVSLNNNLLIVVFGEWSKNNSEFYQFTQTFLLTPAPGANDERFDVANDILRFNNIDCVIKDDEQKKEDEKEKKKKKAEEKVREAVIADKVEEENKVEEKVPEKKLQEKVAEKEVKHKEDTPVKNEELVKEKEVVAEKKPEEAKEVVKPKEEVKPSGEKATAKATTPELEDSKGSSSGSSPQAPVSSSTAPTTAATTVSAPTSSKPLAPISWAALAADAAAKISPITSTVSTNAPTPTPKVKKTQPETTTSNRNYKKEEWYPIYIKGVKSVTEHRLREVLTKEFGELKFFKVNIDIALADFYTQEAQQEALNRKKIKIDGVPIIIETRASQTGVNYHNHKNRKNNGVIPLSPSISKTKFEKKSNNVNKKITKKD